MRAGFHQIPLSENSMDRSTFVTHHGSWKFRRMPFGLRNAPQSFQQLMSSVFRGANYQYLLIYIDDIIIFSRSVDEHLVHLKSVFDRLRDANLRLHPQKCHFLQSEILYLGHILTPEGVKVDEKKLEVLKTYPVPRTVKQVRQFIGYASYYRRFIKNFSGIAAPLTALLKKNQKFVWTAKCQQAFETLRTALYSAPILAFPDMNREFILNIDASTQATAFILSQLDEQGREHPISFGSRTLSDAEKRYTITEIECLALIHAVKAYHSFLAYQKFVVYTDHISLKWLQNIKQHNGRLFRWSLQLQSYDFEVRYRPGRKNVNADVISRLQQPELTDSVTPMDVVPTEVNMPAPHESLSDTVDVTSLQDVAQLIDEIQTFDPATSSYLEQNEEEQTDDSNSYTGYDAESSISAESSDSVDSEELNLSQACNTERTKYITQVNNVEYTEIHFQYDEYDAQHSENNLGLQEITVINNLSDLQQNCNDIGRVITYIKDGELPQDAKLARRTCFEADQYFLQDGILYHQYRPTNKDIQQTKPHIKQIVVPICLRAEILQSYHDDSAHNGIERMYASMREKYYWSSMYADIRMFCRSCLRCQRAKRDYHPQKPPLQPIEPVDLFEKYSTDIIGPFAVSKNDPHGYRYLLLCVESLSHFVELIPLKTQEATEVADALYTHVFARYGAPRYLLSDRGTNYCSALVKRLCTHFAIKQVRTSAFTPRTNGISERFFSSLLNSIRCYIDNQEQWLDYIPAILMGYRGTVSTASTGHSPFYILYGRNMRLPIDNEIRPLPSTGVKSADEYINKMLPKLELTRRVAQENIKRHQEQYKAQHDKNVHYTWLRINQGTKFGCTIQKPRKEKRKSYCCVGLDQCTSFVKQDPPTTY